MVTPQMAKRKKKKEEAKARRAKMREAQMAFGGSPDLDSEAEQGAIELQATDEKDKPGEGGTAADSDGEGKKKNSVCAQYCSPFHEASPLVEMKMYLLFLSLFLISVFFRRRSESYVYNLVLQGRFSSEDFLAIDNEDAFWVYMYTTFLEQLEYDTGYPDKPPYRGSYMVTNVMVRQKRVKREDCNDHALLYSFNNITKRCQYEFSEENESQETYGNRNFVWSDDPQLDVNSKLFNPQRGYGLGGFQVEFVLPLDMNVSHTQIDTMYNNGFIDTQTRLISIERSLYEPNSQLVLAIQQECYFDYLGGITSVENFRVARTLQYETNQEIICAVMEMMFAYFVLYYILEELNELCKKKMAYFQDGWNVIDIMNLGIFVCVIGIRVVVDTAAYDLKEAVNAGDSYVNHQPLLYSFNVLNYANAFNAVLCFLKVFKYLAVSPRLGMLNRVIAIAAWDFLSFLFMFGVVMMGFTMAFYMAFGNAVDDFKTFIDSAFTLFMWSLGGFDFSLIRDQNYFLGGILFILYMVLMMIMLLNFAIAIVSNAFDDANEQAKELKESEFNQEIQEAMHGFKEFICMCIPKATRDQMEKRITQIFNEEDEKKAEGMTRDELIAEYGKEQGEKLFAKFDANDDGAVDPWEEMAMKNQLMAENRHAELEAQLERNEELLLLVLSSLGKNNRKITEADKRGVKVSS